MPESAPLPAPTLRGPAPRGVPSATRGAKPARHAQPTGPRGPFLQAALLVFALWIAMIGGTITFGAWGDVDARMMGIYLAAALVLHGAAQVTGRLVPRILAWALVAAMCLQSEVLARPLVLAFVALLALLDFALHPARAAPRRAQAPLAARLAAVVIGLGVVGVLIFLAERATIDAMMRLATATILAGALAIAAALYPHMRAPERLLPALGVYYLFFVLVAAPVLPFGPALAWWLLCASVLLGALVASRHVSGAEAPADQRRHKQVVRRIEDQVLARAAFDIEAWLHAGAGGEALTDRLAAATGKPFRSDALHVLTASYADGVPPARAHREQALRRLLEATE